MRCRVKTKLGSFLRAQHGSSLTLEDTETRLLIQEEELHHNSSAGVVLSDHSLVLQSITRESAGGYTCMATNVEGRAKSNVVNLEVMCKYVLRALVPDGTGERERERTLMKMPLNGLGGTVFPLVMKFRDDECRQNAQLLSHDFRVGIQQSV